MSQDSGKAVVERVKERWHDAHVQGVHIASVHDFVRGVLYIVEIKDADGDLQENYGYVANGRVRVFGDADELALGIGKVSTIGDVLQSVIELGGIAGIIAGVIAILITLTCCYMTVTRSGFDVPVPLGNALTMILGFYFGTSIHKRVVNKKT
jgi:hypothetical protein